MEKKVNLNVNERLDDLQFNDLFIIQDKTQYNFTTDAVLLANYVKAKPNFKLVDLCSGSGVIGILVHAKTHAEHVVLVEMQQKLYDMSKRSVEFNGLEKCVFPYLEKVQNVSKVIGNELYDVVVCNPPYKMENSSKQSENFEIAVCKHEITINLEEIVLETSKLLKYGGYFYTINKEERLTDLLVLLRKHRIEPKEVVVIPSSKGSPLVMVKARKGGKSGVRIKIMPL